MNETLPLIDETVPEIDLEWQQRLDQLVRGECSEDAFMDHVLNLREANPYMAWNVVALLDQRYRRGQLSAEMFRSIETKIAQYELADIDYGTTIDLLPPPPIPPVSFAARRDGPAIAAPQAPATELAPTATTTAAASVPEIGSTLRNRYVIERRLGTGGMGTVFKALDHYRCDLPEGERHVAMKFLHQRINGRAEILSDLRREFYCAQTLAHPNIVKVYELDQYEDFVFFTMEFLDGELLSAAIERLIPRKLSRSSAWTLIRGVAAGVAHAHSRNVVHADLKPHNIMITSLGDVRILDFGAAISPGRRRDGDASLTGNSTALTPAYASCELLESKPADARDDLYALACVSYELLAGEHPFQRRRSTEARDLGLVARRPEGLTRGQWSALAQGLSWGREDRSIAVSDWLAQMNPPADTQARLSVPLGLHPVTETPKPIPVPAQAAGAAPAANSPSMLLGAVAAVALAVLVFGLWLLLNRRSIETNAVPAVAAAGSHATAESTAGVPISPDIFAPQLPPPLLLSEPIVSRGSSVPVNNSSLVHAPAPARPDVAESAPHKTLVNAINLSTGTYRVRPRQNFAELHVHRTPGAVGNSSFVWWTEPASASAGLDYVPQARITQLLPVGSRAASLFVRLLPNPSRRHSAVFYVMIGEPGNGASLGRVTRTAVVLPPS